jgi:pimeloyl-ACP methyl ester carboxylesterase
MNTKTIAGISVSFRELGSGRPVLLLHGGAGPSSVAGFTDLLGATNRVIAPTHPGFDGTPRPESLTTPNQLAALYISLLDALELENVVVAGTSIGGWIASEIALLGSPRVGQLVLIDAVGITVDGHPVANVFELTLPELMKLSFHDPAPLRIDPSTLTDERKAALAANRATLGVYGGASTDDTLRGRLASITVPTLVVWGESDRVSDPVYGRAFADAIPRAKFQLLPATGHVPQIETPAALLAALAPVL